MKKLTSIMVVLCLLSTIIVPVAADEYVVLPPRDNETDTVIEVFDNLVAPEDGADGDVFIVSYPYESFYDEDNQKGLGEEPLIAPNNIDQTNDFESSDEDWDGDGVPNDEDSCPTVYGEGEHGCPIGADGTEAEVFSLDDDVLEEDENGLSLSLTSIIAGVLLAITLIVGIVIKKKK